MSDLSANIRQTVSVEVYEAGERMVLAGQVTDTRELQNGAVITGVVKDKEPQDHRVYIQVADSDIDGECSCEVGENCAHVVAVLLQARSPAAGNSDVIEEASRRISVTAVTRPGAPIGGRDSTATSRDQHLCYLLEPVQTIETCIPQVYGVRVSLYVGRTSANGTADYQPYIPHNIYGGDYPRYISNEDREILPQLLTLHHEGSYHFQGESGASLLQQCLATGRSYWQDLQAGGFKPGDLLDAEGQWVLSLDGRQQLLFAWQPGIFACLPLESSIYVDTNTRTWGTLQLRYNRELLQQLSIRSPLKPEEVSTFNQQLESSSDAKGSLSALPFPREILVHNALKDTLAAKLQLADAGGSAIASLYFVYNGNAVNSHTLTPEQPHVRYLQDNALYQVMRDTLEEDRLRESLFSFNFVPVMLTSEGRGAVSQEQGLTLGNKREWLSFMLKDLPALRAAGWEVEISAAFPYRVAETLEWYGELSGALPAPASIQGTAHHTAYRATDWFSLELGILIDGQSVNLLPILVEQLKHLSPDLSPEPLNTHSALANQQIDDQLLLPLPDGRFLPVPMARIHKIMQALVELYDQDCLNDQNQLELPRSQAGRLAELAKELCTEDEEELAWTGDEALQALAQRLSDFDGIEPLDPPSGFRAQLRSYQQEGLGWLQFLRQYEAGGILADDMGLGKTIQTLAHLATEKQAGRLQQPSLVVAPTSLMGNWRQEAERFAPMLKVITLHGARRKQYFAQMAEADVVLTTYPLINIDAEELLRQEFYLLILDEAQTIKNPRAKVSQLVRQLTAEHRLCLTGTPMENHLGELWSLFDFLQPGFLGDERKFQQEYRNPIEKLGDEERAQGLAKRIAPFILRRTKSAVATELPPKTEILRRIPLGEAQRDLYDSIRLTMHKQIRQVIKTQGFARSQIAVLDALLKLRQVCCDPRLLGLEAAKGVTESAKFEVLMEMVPELVEEGRRILLFSQFTSMLDLIETAVTDLGIPFVKLTGKTKDRAQVVEHFQAGEVPLFLISLKAGGTGLNLTAADTVIHYDPWWNPAAENQATDRAYRIGQDKPVFVYKLVTEGTVEEKILYLQKSKQDLAAGLYGAKTSSPTRLGPEDMEQLFEPLTDSEYN